MRMTERDLIIVGSGGGAFVAALAAHEAGLRPLIVEKRDLVGGTTGYSGGVIWIPNNPVMKREGVPDSLADASRYLEHLIGPPGPGSTREKRDAFLNEGPDMVTFLEAQGMSFSRPEGWSDYHDELPGGSARGRGLVAPLFDLKQLGEWQAKLSTYEHWTLPMNSAEAAPLMLVTRNWAGRRMAAVLAWRMLAQRALGRSWRGSGAALQGRLLQIALRRKIPIMTETAVTGFIVENGRVTGVTTLQNGVEKTLRASRGVLLNAGGFAHNAAMRTAWQPKPTPQWTNANPGDTGEVLEAAMALGAQTHNLDLSWYLPTSIMPDGSLPPGVSAPFIHHLDIAKPHVIMVDATGARFCDEAGAYHDIGKDMYAGAQWPLFAILDSRHRKWYAWGMQPPGRVPKKWLESGYFQQAQSLRELAQKCGIDEAGLEKTVARFNEFCVTGVDEDFARGGRAFDRHHGDPTIKPNPNLGAIAKPPFYAVRMAPGDIGTNGGLLTDEHARVLGADSVPIPGLYATGNITASVMGRSYPGPGGTIGPAMVFGYVAARHAITTGNNIT
jgi:3-oxosteroid 1-dehydrogenase